MQIDICGGDLPRTKRGHKFVLVLCCTVSKWVIAIPLRNIRAKTIAQKLIETFCSIGIPSVLRLDNAAAFRSELFTEFADKLGIDLRFSSVGHAQSHGLVERTNHSLEQMLKKYIHQFPKVWDDLLPYLLFAMREAKNESTNYSPAELVYGHSIRGWLAVQRSCWERGDRVERELKIPAVEFMQNLNAKIETALAHARDNVTTAQARMKNYYDQHSQERKLDVGEQVLVLEPTCNNKLLAQWVGPRRVLQKLNDNNYLIETGGKRTRKLHINSLRKFHTDTPVKPGDAVNVIIGDTDSDAEVDRPATDSGDRSDDGSVINADNAGASNDTDGRTDTEAISAECGGDVEREVGDFHLPEFVTGQQLTDEQNNQWPKY